MGQAFNLLLKLESFSFSTNEKMDYLMSVESNDKDVKLEKLVLEEKVEL